MYVDNFNIIAEREEDAVYFDFELAKAIDTRVGGPECHFGGSVS